MVEVAAYGEVVWSWHPLLMLSLAEAKPAQPGEVAVNPLGDGDKKEFVAEESTKETVKTIARGKPGDLRRNRGDYRVLTTNAHGLRVLRAPGFPCSLFKRGTMFVQSLGDSRREKAKVRVLSINAHHTRSSSPRMRVIQYSRDAGAGNEKPRRTGYPAFAGYDGFLFCARRSLSEGGKPGDDEWRAAFLKFEFHGRDDGWMVSRPQSSTSSCGRPNKCTMPGVVMVTNTKRDR